MVGLICLSLLHLGESMKCLTLLALIFRRWLCRAVALLDGARLLQDLGSEAARLESPFTTTLAFSSALSFPGIPSQPGVHRSSMVVTPCFLCAAMIWFWNLSSKC